MKQVDCRGLVCPWPVVHVQRALAAGEYPIQVLVDNKEAAVNIKTLLDNNQCKFVERASQGITTVEISQGSLVTAAVQGGKLWLITGSTLGRGSEELGAALMKSFLFALEEQQSPGILIFLNAGVLLTAGSQALSHQLGRLDVLGWRIESCGTCLDYYHLKDDLRVGSVTNMFAILQWIAEANGVITI